MTPTIKTPYLEINRTFPQDPGTLTNTLGKTYFEIAYAVNARTIGIFDKFQVVTGERWFATAPVNIQAPQLPDKRQTYRQVYTFGTIAAGGNATFPHNITGVTAFTRIYGTAITTLPDYRPIPYTDAVAATNQIQINVNATNVIVTNGSTAQPITSGIVVLEYLLN